MQCAVQLLTRIVPLLLVIALVLIFAASSIAQPQGPIPTFRVPDDQVPLDRVHTVGEEQVIQVTDSRPSPESSPSWSTLSQHVPDEMAPENVKTIEMKQVITFP